VKRGLIVIRADADAGIGIGHIGRTLALTAAWRQGGGQVRYVATAPLAASAEAWIASAGIGLHIIDAKRYSDEDARQTAALAAGATVVMDAFGTPLAYRSALRAQVARLAIIDDVGGSGPWAADIIVNQNYGASATLYPDRDPNAALLFGPRFALLRPEFARWRTIGRRRNDAARRIAVSLGGTDPKDVTSLVLSALETLPASGWRAIVVAGAANPRTEALKIRAAASARHIHVRRSPSSMARLLAWADVAILAGGVTVWEALSLGVPVIGIAVAANQVPAAEALAQDGLWHYLGQVEEIGPERISDALGRLLADDAERRRLADAGSATVDGQGAARVAEALARL
jgi:UDP-2,4-diacetamido-2,4,6-trideoxy-beta-L-altropyranose hydrolase